MPMVLDCGDRELELVRKRFLDAVSDWNLDAVEMAALLDLPWSAQGADVRVVALDGDAEMRLRLATEVAHALDRVFERDALLEWLRDDEDEEVTPLAFMSRGVTELRAMRAAAAARSS